LALALLLKLLFYQHDQSSSAQLSKRINGR
jgi:hypothetical protein